MFDLRALSASACVYQLHQHAHVCNCRAAVTKPIGPESWQRELLLKMRISTVASSAAW